MIVEELNTAQGKSIDLKGYYLPNKKTVSDCMRPSTRFNTIIDNLIESI